MTTTTQTTSWELAVAKGREPKKAEDKQVSFRIPPALYGRVEAAAEGLQLDVSSLLRMMIRQNLPTYEQQADAVRRRESGEG